MKKNCGISSIFSSEQKPLLETIESVAKIHDKICDACLIAEQYFTIQMLTIVTIGFIIIVFNLYYVLEACFENDYSGTHFGTVEFVVFFTYQIAMYTTGIVCVCSVSSGASRAVNF